MIANTNENQINPLYLIKDASVKVTYDDKKFTDIAAVKMISKDNYEILFNLDEAEKFYRKSWAKGMAPFSSFEKGLLLHEISHILYKSFDCSDPVSNGLFHTIKNILLDSQCEYSITRDHPSIAKFLRFSLSILKRNTDFSATKMPSLSVKKDIDEINKKVSEVFCLTRFGVVKQDADHDFINFVYPFILSSTRKDVHAVQTVAKIIYQRIVNDVEDESTLSAISLSKPGRGSVTTKDIAEIESGDQITSSSITNIVDDVKSGMFASPKGDTDIQVVDTDNEFYRETIIKYHELIQGIRRAFKLRMNKTTIVKAVDGNLNLKRQQQAYVDSYTQEVNFNYTYSKILERLIDVVILRDISSSTSSMSNDYCRLTIALIAALEGLPGISLAQIDFSTGAAVNLAFGENVRQSRIAPRCEGGTDIVPAYLELEKFKWRAKKRIGIIITDGEIYSPEKYKPIEERLSMNLGFKHQKWEIGRGYGRGRELRYTTLATFPQDIAKWLLESV